MKISSQNILSALPAGVTVEAVEQEGLDSAVIGLSRDRLAAGGLVGLHLEGLTKFLALERYGMWWNRPRFGTAESQVPPDTQYLLWRRADGAYGLLLPLIDGDLRGWLAGEDGGLALRFHGAGPAGLPDRAELLLAAVGEDPYALTRLAVAAAAKRLATFRPREEKAVPAFVDHFGWCTWDAFYGEVNHEKVLAGLETFRAGGLLPGFVILDDGWLDADPDKNLLSFRPSRTKFPRGLAEVIAQAKTRYGVKIFAVWHTLQGYWNGVSPQGELAPRYRVVTNRASSPKGEEAMTRHFVHPDDACRFYQEWYQHLRAQGVDMTKVDSQSSLMAFTNGLFGQATAMRAYQQALTGASFTHMRGNLIHCMSNGSDVAYNMPASLVWRNSDDYYPSKPESHVQHIHNNAMNNLWTSTFSLPDWDMFQSGHPAGAFHAAARAISGGPVYVSDKPGQQDFPLLRKLVTSDGRVLRCDRPALPAEDCLLADCLTEPRLLKIANRNGPVGVLGLFNCRWSPDGEIPVADRFAPADVPGLAGGRFAVYLHRAGSLTVLARAKRQAISLGAFGFEIATISPISHGLAPLGLLDKFNGSRAVEEFRLQADGTFRYRLRDGGRIGLYCAKAPKRVLSNGKKVRADYDAPSGLLVIHRPEGKAAELTVAI